MEETPVRTVVAEIFEFCPGNIKRCFVKLISLNVAAPLVIGIRLDSMQILTRHQVQLQLRTHISSIK